MMYPVFKFFHKIFSRYESRSMLRNYILAQYGPFLSEPYLKSEGLYQEVISTVHPFIHEGSALLDVGCAIGRLVFEYEKMGAKYSAGIDTSETFINFCQKMKTGGTNIAYEVTKPSSADFIYDDVFVTDKLDKNSFDLISCINIIDRVHNPQALTHKLHELLKPGGVLVVADPYHWSLSPAPVKFHVQDIKQLLDPDMWSVENEKQGIDYTIPISETSEITYACHLVVAKRKG